MNGSGAIKTVAIVDDDVKAQESESLAVQDAGFIATIITGPLGTLSDFLHSSAVDHDALLFDYKLSQGPYASFDGAEAVASLYGKLPCLLCTMWSPAMLDSMRPYRSRIPVLIPSDSLDGNAVLSGLEICLQESRGNFLPNRVPTQAIVRIEDVDRDQKPGIVYAVVPGWNHKEVVRFPITIIPGNLQPHVKVGERFLAKVNLGADDQSQLYFEDFEYRS